MRLWLWTSDSSTRPARMPQLVRRTTENVGRQNSMHGHQAGPLQLVNDNSCSQKLNPMIACICLEAEAPPICLLSSQCGARQLGEVSQLLAVVISHLVGRRSTNEPTTR